MQLIINDRTSYRITKRDYTDEGFLRVPGRVARTGIQEYLASELGLDGDPNRVVNVYRPAEEVFKPESLNSYDGTDITIEHPETLVDSQNYKDVSVGVVRGQGIEDNDFVQCDLIIKDKVAVDAVNTGKVELSAGYTAMYEQKDGVAPCGTSYEFTQRDIRINHVALVDKARAGANARIFDNNRGNRTMIVINLDSGPVEVADQATATLINNDRNALLKRATDAESEKEKAEAKADMLEKDMEEEKKKSSDSAIAKRVDSLMSTRDGAIKIAGDKFACDSTDLPTIQRAALTVSRDSVDWAKKSDTYVQAAFDMEMEKEENDTEEEEKEKENNDSQLSQLSKDAAAKGVKTASDAKSKATLGFTDAWKKTIGEGA